jgi:hypothetical protein
MLKALRWSMVVAALLTASGCSAFTEPKPLEEFEYIAVANPADVQEGVDAAPFFGEINLLGQFKTPSLCFTLSPSFRQDGSTLNLTVEAKPTNSSNCENVPGGFRYTGVLRHIDAGQSYTLHVTHVVPGSANQEFSIDITL